MCKNSTYSRSHTLRPWGVQTDRKAVLFLFHNGLISIFSSFFDTNKRIKATKINFLELITNTSSFIMNYMSVKINFQINILYYNAHVRVPLVQCIVQYM